ncbi:prepilin peptidase [Geodermatophilus sp. SYSU D00815]
MFALVTAVLGMGVGALANRAAGAFPWRERPLGRPAVRPPLLELGTGGLLGLLAAALGPSWSTPAFLAVAAVGVLLAVVDLRHRLLPDRVVVPALAGCLVLLTAAAALGGEWPRLLRAVLGAAALFAVFLALALVSPGGMGMGDVKLAALLGLPLGWLGWGAVVLGAAAGFLVQAALALVLLATGRVGPRGELPFGPAMLAGALAVTVWVSVSS